MRKLFRAFALLIGLSGVGFTQAAPATASPDDAQVVRQVIRAQLDAFAADDAERAFSFASKSIRDMFGNSAQFMAMVRASYPVVYRPASVTFLSAKPIDGEVVQPVHMTDPQGGSWMALYRMERQADKSWRIAGCVLVPNKAQTT